MKKYELEILYPSSSRLHTKQSKYKKIECANMIPENGYYKFINEVGRTIAYYPIQYTIIFNIIFDINNEVE